MNMNMMYILLLMCSIYVVGVPHPEAVITIPLPVRQYWLAFTVLTEPTAFSPACRVVPVTTVGALPLLLAFSWRVHYNWLWVWCCN